MAILADRLSDAAWRFFACLAIMAECQKHPASPAARGYEARAAGWAVQAAYALWLGDGSIGEG